MLWLNTDINTNRATVTAQRFLFRRWLLLHRIAAGHTQFAILIGTILWEGA